MKRIALFALFILTIPVFAQSQSEQHEVAKELGVNIIQMLQQKEYDRLTPLFSEKLAEKAKPQKLEKLIDDLYKEYGKVVAPKKFSEKVTAEETYYHHGIEFARGNFDLVFTLDEANLLTSFRLAPYTPQYNWSPPSYADVSQLQFEDIQIGDESPLTGEFTFPKKGNKETIVVMVHGSGPNDMDESVGPNKLFKDLAYGLGTNGIASIRYHKRSYDYPSASAKMMNDFTFDHVVTDDAIKAIEKARMFGAKKVILLGHSLGGHFAPRIASKIAVDGVIVMAGNSSQLHKLLVSQYEHIMKNDSSSGITEFQLNMIKSQVKNVEDENYDENTLGMTLPLGLPGKCWMDLKNYKPAKLSRTQSYPYLILNGERDYQVPPSEAKKWKNGSKNKQSKTIVYPGLNHMFFHGEGVCIPSEYETEAHLNEKVLKDITNWVNSL